VNDATEAAFARDTVAGLFGAERATIMSHPIPGAEDFSYVLQEVPGAFVFLGACPDEADPLTAPSNHSARAMFDDSVLADGTTLLAELALQKLASVQAR
jgi:metal-dependent amidase/aminoacylase/carboxypeptidase family protein